MFELRNKRNQNQNTFIKLQLLPVGPYNSSSCASSWSQFASFPIFTFYSLPNRVKYFWPWIIGTSLGIHNLVSEAKTRSIALKESNSSIFFLFLYNFCNAWKDPTVSYDLILLCTGNNIVKLDHVSILN